MAILCKFTNFQIFLELGLAHYITADTDCCDRVLQKQKMYVVTNT